MSRLLLGRSHAPDWHGLSLTATKASVRVWDLCQAVYMCSPTAGGLQAGSISSEAHTDCASAGKHNFAYKAFMP